MTEGYGILQPRVGVSLPGDEPVALRAAVRRRAGHRPVHARRLRRLPGRVRRRLVHRQGHLRRRCVRARARRALSREPHPEPRSARGLLRALGLLSDVQLYEEYPVALQRRREPPASLDPRRLADRGMAAAARARARQAPAERNPLSALSQWKILDNLRRSLVPAALTLLLLLGWTVLPHAWFWTLVGARHPAASVRRAPSLARAVAASRTRCCCGSISRPPRARLRRHVAQAAARRSRSCRTRRSSASMRSCARSWRMLVTHRRLLEWNPSSDGGSRARATRSRTDLARVLSGRCGSRRRSPLRRLALSGGTEPVGVGGRRRRSCSCGSPRPAIAWWISRPLARREARADDRADALPAQARAPDLGVLRDLRRPGRPLAAARQLPGASGRRGRASHVADQHGTGAAGEPGGVRLRLHLRPDSSSSARRTLCARWTRWSGTRATSTTGTTRRRCKPLPPLYVSTVDSGNLAGHLLTLRPGLLALADDRILSRDGSRA